MGFDAAPAYRATVDGFVGVAWKSTPPAPGEMESEQRRIMNEMEITIKVPDKLAAEARAHGLSVEVYVQEILAKQTREIAGEQGLESVRSAISRILELRKGNKLAGFRPQDLVHEGRKY